MPYINVLRWSALSDIIKIMSDDVIYHNNNNSKGKFIKVIKYLYLV